MEEKEDFWGEIESTQNESIPSVMISGEPQTVPAAQQMYGAQQQMILLQQPSSAPKVIGIFVIIYGALNTLGGLLGLFSGALLSDAQVVGGNEFSIQIVLFSLLSMGFGIGFIITGVQINNRKKIGVQLSWILIALSLVIGILQTMLTPTEDLEAVGFDSGAFYALQIGGQVVCNAICGLLVAIPLMVSNSMMDDSSLWG
tara:strand:- start:1059 stop:1658 length:600 start_codon:yes stop_codon:yes gene_type:complete